MNKNLPKVSIGISFYNSELTLLNAVRSVFMQTHKNWELILIDDGSTDSSLEIALAIDDPRVHVYSDGKNKKLAARLNQIIQLAQYDFIVRMDADDLMAPDRIEKQLRILLEQNDIDLVSTGVLSLNSNREPVGARSVKKDHVLTPSNLIFSRSGIIHASIMARKSWYQRNCYNESFPVAQDKELWVRAYSNSDLNIFFIREYLYFYNEDGSVTKKKLLRAYKISRRIIKESAGLKFTKRLKFYSYFSYMLKSFIVYFSSFFGNLSYIRNRRNKEQLSVDEKKYYHKIIKSICSYTLPIKK